MATHNLCNCHGFGCSCAPQVQLSTQTVARSVPENYEVSHVVNVPYDHTVVRHVPKTVVEDVPHTYHKTVVEQKSVDYKVPVYKTVPKTT